MRMKLLREFVLLSKNLNFSKTAQDLFITQSVLSKHIASLEEAVGATLFIRSHHHVELTEIGKLFLVEVIQLLKQYDDSISKINMALAGLEKELKIGYLLAHTRDNLVPAVHRFEKQSPNTKLQLTAADYWELPEMLENDEVDIVCTIYFDTDNLARYDTCPIYEDVLCVAVDKSHPLAQKQNIVMADLISEQILLPSTERYMGLAAFLNDIFNENDFPQDQIIRYSCISSSLLMVAAGEIIAIIPEKLKANASENVLFIPFKDGQYLLKVIAAWKKTNNNPAIKKFIQTLSHD